MADPVILDSLAIVSVELPTPHRFPSGPVKFGFAGEFDWPGIFIRGDTADGIACALTQIADGKVGTFGPTYLRLLASELRSCYEKRDA